MSRKMMLWERVVFGTFSEEMERKETAWAPWHDSANHSRVLLGILALTFL
jgi:hypothetical protein